MTHSPSRYDIVSPSMRVYAIDRLKCLLPDGRMNYHDLSMLSGTALLDDDSNYLARIDHARAAFETESFEEAARLYNQALASLPEFVELHYWLAESLMRINQVDDALEHYNLFLIASIERPLLLRVPPEFRDIVFRLLPPVEYMLARANYQLGRIYYNKGDIENAMARWRLAAEHTDIEATAKLAIAQVLFARNDFKSCYALLSTSKPYNHQDEKEWFYILGHSAYHLGEFDAAVSALETSFKAGQPSEYVVPQLISAIAYNGHLHQARETLSKHAVHLGKKLAEQLEAHIQEIADETTD